ncbi:MAG: hypothetical protein K2M87_03355 [Muribaculaceae bacterium]|nr:hypothetical protein [Muribaculaceae bacterium]
MTKFYLWTFVLLLVMLTGLSSYANYTIKVNDAGIGVLQFDGGDGVITFNENVNTLAPNVADMLIGTLKVPNTYTMTVRNESRGMNIDTSEYDGEIQCPIHPGFMSNGETLSVTVSGGGVAPVVPTVTFLMNPDGCAYIATAHYDNGTYVIDDVYNTPNDDGAIEVPYKQGTYLVKPNSGYTLTKALNESETNPHYSGDLPSGDGTIYLESGSFKAGAQFVIFASQSGSFTVKGIGSNVSSISMMSLKTYQSVNVTDVEKSVNFGGGESYMIRANSSSPLWKVEVTNDGETSLLAGDYGNYEYTPDNGDSVVIYTDRPETHANIKISFSGDGVDNNIVNNVMYDGTVVNADTWNTSAGWTVTAGKQLNIMFNTEGFMDFACKINGVSQPLSTSYTDNKKYVNYYVENDDVDVVKEINVVISARKEKKYNVTLVCAHPEAVTVRNENYEVYSFTTSPSVISVPENAAQINIQPNNGWLVDGISVDNDPDASSKFVYGLYEVPGDCVITISVTNLAEKRNKTAVVYVDESVANPIYLSFRFQEYSEQTIVPGYNFVKYCDEDRPFHFGYYTGGDPVFVVNDQVITGSPSPCAETLDFQDFGVIKYFSNNPVTNIVSYDLEEDIMDIVEIYHDHYTNIDFNSETEYNCYPGTMIHIKPVSQTSQAHKRAATAPFEVAVNDEKLTPDADGVYSYKVTDGPVNVKVAEQITTGVDADESDNGESSVVYNLHGIAVANHASSQQINALPAGVYIIGGKKVVVK